MSGPNIYDDLARERKYTKHDTDRLEAMITVLIWLLWKKKILSEDEVRRIMQAENPMKAMLAERDFE